MLLRIFIFTLKRRVKVFQSCNLDEQKFGAAFVLALCNFSKQLQVLLWK